jgi:hypothetical protein
MTGEGVDRRITQSGIEPQSESRPQVLVLALVLRPDIPKPMIVSGHSRDEDEARGRKIPRGLR